MEKQLSACDVSKSLEAQFEQKHGKHPRILLSDLKLKQIRAMRNRSVYDALISRAVGLAHTQPPAYYEDRDAAELWQRDVGEAISTLSFAYAVTGEKQFLDGAECWALASAAYPCWGRGDPDLPAGQQLFGLAVFYDWCGTAVSEQTRISVEEALVRHGADMYEAARATGYWRKWNLQNHMWINLAGLGTAGIVLYDKYPYMTEWTAFAVQRYLDVMDSLGPDGASHEGVMYWHYGVYWMLLFMDVVRDMFHIDMFCGNKWFEQTAYYRMYMGLPLDSATVSQTTVDFGDASRCDAEGPCTVMDKLASEYQCGCAAWFSEAMRMRNLNSDQGSWADVMWSVDLPKAVSVEQLPTYRHFSDMDFVSARSGWTGDASLVAFKCGPFIGHDAMDKTARPPYLDWGGGHVHQDANHFVFFANGQYLLRDDGYTVKSTESHNTLLVNGKGQQGGDQPWFRGEELLRRNARPHIIASQPGKQFDYFAGAAAQAYPPELGVKRFDRHMLYIKPDLLLVADDIEVERESALELRFFPESTQAVETADGWVFPGKNADLRACILDADGGQVSCNQVGVYLNISGARGKRTALCLAKKGTRFRTLTVFQYTLPGKPFQAVSAKQKNGVVRIVCGEHVAYLHMEERRAWTDTGLAAILVNGAPITGFSPQCHTYTYDAHQNVRIVRPPYDTVTVRAVANEGTAPIRITPPNGKYGKYQIAVGDGEPYTVTVSGKEFHAKRAKIFAVHASAYQASHPIENILDDDPNTYWTAEGEHSVIIDMGKTVSVAGIDIAWFKGDVRIQRFDMEVSEEGVHYMPVASYETSGVTDLPEYYEAVCKGRYIRLLLHGNTQGQWNSIIHIGVYVNA